MHDSIQCAMLHTPASDGWADRWLGIHGKGRLRVSRVIVAELEAMSMGKVAGGTMAWSLRQEILAYDVCLFPVCLENLSWARMILGQHAARLGVPVIALVHGLQAAALQDLLSLGVADFVRDPGCLEELRTRASHALAVCRAGQMAALAMALGDGAVEADAGLPADDVLREAEPRYLMNASDLPVDDVGYAVMLQRHGMGIEAFAAAAASRCAAVDEPFRQAKGRVVASFERAYVAAALGRHAGNIAQAARQSHKHRRAFWQLMRKHRISAEIYRPQV